MTSRLTLIEHFADLPDPRKERTRCHKLIDILIIAVCALICGAQTFVDMQAFGKAKEDWLKARLGLDLTGGIPSHDTFGRVFAALDPQAFCACFIAWTEAIQAATKGEVVALDGKTLRHSFDTASGKGAIHMVSAWAASRRLVLGQVKVDDKSNEITALAALLSLLCITGCVVTIDAIGCQKQIAQHIIAQEGDYVLALKDNHPKLHDEVRRLFVWARGGGAKDVACDLHESRTYDHGRQEIRRCWTTGALSWLDETDEPGEWAGLSGVALVECERTAAGKTSREWRCFLSSLSSDARKTLGAVRRPWGIENKVHWILDVALGEDDCRIRCDNAPQNMATLRHLVLNLLRQETTAKTGIKNRRLRAGWDHDYLLKVLAS